MQKALQTITTTLTIIALTACTQTPTGPPQPQHTEWIITLTTENNGINLMNNDTITTLAAQILPTATQITPYEFIQAFSVHGVTENEINELRTNPQIHEITPNLRINMFNNNDLKIQYQAPWHLDRIDQITNDLDDKYHYRRGGKGINIYIVDTLVWGGHNELRDRVAIGYQRSPIRTDPQKCHPHGTSVAAVAAGKTVGIAREANIISVELFDCIGYVSIEEFVKSLEWVYHNLKRPAVVNLSGGIYMRVGAIDRAAEAIMSLDVPFVAAAGNYRWKTACEFSPAWVEPVITVSATDKYDSMPYWATAGSCVDILAPGETIRTANLTRNDGYHLISGTSLSAPAVAGTIALILEEHPTAGREKAREILINMSVKDKITELRSWTPNRLLHIPNNHPLPEFCPECVTDTGGFSRLREGPTYHPPFEIQNRQTLDAWLYQPPPGTTTYGLTLQRWGTDRQWHTVTKTNTGRMTIQPQTGRYRWMITRDNQPYGNYIIKHKIR
jgi:hypothetical protein